jgi:hypothetical protein
MKFIFDIIVNLRDGNKALIWAMFEALKVRGGLHLLYGLLASVPSVPALDNLRCLLIRSIMALARLIEIHPSSKTLFGSAKTGVEIVDNYQPLMAILLSIGRYSKEVHATLWSYCVKNKIELFNNSLIPIILNLARLNGVPTLYDQILDDVLEVVKDPEGSRALLPLLLNVIHAVVPISREELSKIARIIAFMIIEASQGNSGPEVIDLTVTAIINRCSQSSSNECSSSVIIASIFEVFHVFILAIPIST